MRTKQERIIKQDRSILKAIDKTGDPDFYRTGPPWGEHDPLYNLILALVLRWEPHESAIDLGCFLGDFTARLKEVGVKHIVGVDVSPIAIQYARYRYPEITFVVSDIVDLKYVEEFDIAIASGVLNFKHLTEEDYSLAIEKTSNLLRLGGYLIVQNPWDAIQEKEEIAFNELTRFFTLIHELNSVKHDDYAYRGRREHGKHRYYRLYKKTSNE